MRIAGFVVGLFAATLLSTLSPATAGAQITNTHRLYLPHLPKIGPEPCARAISGHPSCPPPPSWELLCGGSGQIRDMLSLRDGRVIAVGDGIVTYKVLERGESGPLLVERRVHAQSDLPLVGLESLTAVEDRLWAVGDEGQRLTTNLESQTEFESSLGCWSRIGGFNAGDTLESIRVKEHNGVIFVLRLAGTPHW